MELVIRAHLSTEKIKISLSNISISTPGLIFNKTKIAEKYSDLPTFDVNEYFLNAFKKFKYLTQQERLEPFKVKDRYSRGFSL